MKRIILTILLFLQFAFAYSQSQRILFHAKNTAVINYDSDAQLFFTAAGITDATMKNAIDRYVRHQKGQTLSGDVYTSWVDNWTSNHKAIYLYFTGSAASVKYNLRSPVDADANFRQTLNGGWTYSSTGATPNGTNGYVDTHVSLATDITTYDRHFSIAYGTHTTTEAYAAVYHAGSGAMFGLQAYRNSDTKIVAGMNNLAAYDLNTDSRGYYIVSVNGANDGNLYKDGVHLQSSITNVNKPDADNFFIGALNVGGTPAGFEDRKIQIATLGLKLDAAAADSDYNAWLVLKSDLGL